MFVIFLALVQEEDKQHLWNEKMLVYTNMLQFEQQCRSHEVVDGVTSGMGTDPKMGTWYRGYCINAYILGHEYLRLKNNYLEKYGKDDFNADDYIKNHFPMYGTLYPQSVGLKGDKNAKPTKTP